MSASVSNAQHKPQADPPPRWPKGLLLLTVLLAFAAPLAMLSGRLPGLGELDYLIYYRLLFFNDFYNSLAMLAALLVALAVPGLRIQVERLATWLSLHPMRGCVIGFVGLAVAARIVYQGFPLAMDEYAPLLQARIFAQGDIAITYPRELIDRMVVPGFQGSFILVNHETGQAVSGYWPGLALLMTPFALFGGEWLVNPLLGAVGLWLIGDLAKQASGVENARGWAMLAALASPQYTVNAMSYYAMTGLLTLNLLFLWLLLRRSWKAATLAGFVGSVALVMHNPAPHTLFAIPCMAWLLWGAERRVRLIPLAIGYLPLTALLLLGWPVLTSSMGLRPVEVSIDGAGFIVSWINKLQNTFILPNLEILLVRSYAAWKTMIWAAPGALVAAFLVKPKTDAHKLLLAAILLMFAFYLFFPYDQGHGWGYRYIHPAWGLIPFAAALFATSGNAAKRSLIAAAVFAGLAATPMFLHTTHRTIAMSADQELPLSEEGRTIVFLAPQHGVYTYDLVRNYPKDHDNVIRMISEGTDQDRQYVDKIAPAAIPIISDRRGSSWAVASNAPRTSE